MRHVKSVLMWLLLICVAVPMLALGVGLVLGLGQAIGAPGFQSAAAWFQKVMDGGTAGIAALLGVSRGVVAGIWVGLFAVLSVWVARDDPASGTSRTSRQRVSRKYKEWVRGEFAQWPLIQRWTFRKILRRQFDSYRDLVWLKLGPTVPLLLGLIPGRLTVESNGASQAPALGALDLCSHGVRSFTHDGGYGHFYYGDTIREISAVRTHAIRVVACGPTGETIALTLRFNRWIQPEAAAFVAMGDFLVKNHVWWDHDRIREQFGPHVDMAPTSFW